jgi:S1-C subfamily serine protease
LLASLVFLTGCESSRQVHSNSAQPTPDQPAPDQPTPAQPTPAQPAPNQPNPAQLPSTQPTSFADVVAKVRPAVVNIYTRKEVVTPARRTPFAHRGMVPRRRVAESLGSGFIIDEQGHLLTNYHVVKNATDIGVRLLDERFFAATLIGADPKTDVAVLRIELPDTTQPTDLPVISMGDSQNLRVGDWVVAIGNPLGLTSTVTAGIASAIGRKGIPISEEMHYQDFIQTDASINPGNSGGPLINADGEVVGINTAISAEGQGIGFAIPINMARDIVPQLKKSGHVERSWLGIYVDKVPRALRRELALPDDIGGALVTRVVPGGPAEAASLRSGDIVLSIDDEPIDDAGQLAWLASNLGIGRTVDVAFQRGDKRTKTKLTMGALPD